MKDICCINLSRALKLVVLSPAFASAKTAQSHDKREVPMKFSVRRGRSVVSLVKIALLATALLACVATEALGATISGTVTYRSGGAPITGVQVSIYRSDGALLQNTSTDNAGNYSFFVAAGTYYVRTINSGGFLVGLPKLVDQLYLSIDCNYGCPVTTGLAIQVTDFSVVTNINFSLSIGGGISGTVKNALTAAVVPSFPVELYSSGGSFVSSVTTNAAGIYTFTGLIGQYYVRTSGSGTLVNQLYNGITCISCNVATSGGTLVTVLPPTTVGVNFNLAPVASANQSPHAVASAGVDPSTGHVLSSVTLYIGPADSGIPHTIAGGGSSDPDGDPLTYRWDCTDQATGNKCLFFGVATNQVNYRPTFPPGTYDITLTVNDGNLHTATDSVRVRVLVDLSPPTVTPPDNESVSATEAGGARGGGSSDLHKFLFNSATATDNSTAIFTHLPPQINGADVDDNTLLPHGTTTVTFRIADNFGNVGTATADVFVTDLQSGDLFVGVQPTAFTILGGLQPKGLVQRIRGGSVTDFCQSPDPPNSPLPLLGVPVFWRRPDQIALDSKGRVAFLADLRWGGSLQSGWGLLRCNLPGQPPEQLAIFPQASNLDSPLPPGSSIDPSWPVPFPGRTFYGALPVTGLHLRKTKHVLIDDNVNNGNPQIVTEEKYVLAFQDSVDPGSSNGHIGSLSLNTESLVFAEDDIFPVGVGGTTSSPAQDMLPEMFFHSKMETVSSLGLLSFPAPVAKTYVSRDGVLRRILQPFEVQLTANTSAGTVQFGVQAFGGHTDIPGSPANSPVTGFIIDDVTVPNPPSGCIPPPGVRGDWPQIGGGYAGFTQGAGVVFEKNSGLVVINSGTWHGQLDEALFDLDPQNDLQSYFARPETGCKVEPVVNVTPMSRQTDFLLDRMTASPNGLFGTIAVQGRVVQATGTLDVSDVATGLLAPRGLGAFPPQLGSVHVSALIIRIDSPVDVVLTDALGRRIGVSNGQAIDEFGGQAFDSGAQTHPRLYIIQFPQPGDYSVRSTGTGTGSFTVHIYSVDSAKHATEHLISSGNASPGSSGKHDFILDAQNKIAFSNAAPVAEAGFDQTADADASGNATFALDGSLSSDPDGDGLTFTWAGPFGILSGAQINATLPVGVHVLQLTVDDGKGGSAEDTVQITVNAVAPPADTTPPVLTLPADMTLPATSASGAVVNYSALASDSVDGSVAPACAPASGSNFPVGATTVNCTATDVAGNSASGSFSVTVIVGTPRIAGTLVARGSDALGNRYFEVRLTNTGTGHARNLKISQLLLRTLSGSGIVTYLPALSGALPLSIGNLDVGASSTIRLYLSVPATVTRFSITESGAVQNVVDTQFSYSTAQSVIP